MLGPSYRNMQKPPYPGVDLHKHASGTMPMNLICSQRDFVISPTHNEQKYGSLNVKWMLLSADTI